MAETLEYLVEEQESDVNEVLGQRATEVAFGQMSLNLEVNPDQFTFDLDV